jgi:DNA topoisomerase-1
MSTQLPAQDAPAKARRSRKIKLPEVVKDPIESAKVAGLRYVSDATPGIRRLKRGENFRYVDPDGKPVRDKDTLARIRSLAIPPAYQDVWICPDPDGHLQFHGVDARGRKQYRYHQRWRAQRDETKYTRMIAFGQALPRIRERTTQDIKKPGLSRERVLATVVQLLEKTLIRVGNEEYTRDNKSYGLTTLRNRHIDVEGSRIHFEFKGKSGVKHAIDLNDRRLARVVEQISELPGQEVFQYVDENGERHSVNSSDVNAYLKEVSGEDFTAKDFRTWAGTILASLALQEFEKFDSETQAKKNVVQAIENVAERLGNTPSVCRKCYVHPAVLNSYLDGSLADSLERRVAQEMEDTVGNLRPEESAVMALLHNRLEQEKQTRSND